MVSVSLCGFSLEGFYTLTKTSSLGWLENLNFPYICLLSVARWLLGTDHRGPWTEDEWAAFYIPKDMKSLFLFIVSYAGCGIIINRGNADLLEAQYKRKCTNHPENPIRCFGECHFSADRRGPSVPNVRDLWSLLFWTRSVVCPVCAVPWNASSQNTMPMLLGAQSMAFRAAVWSDLIITVWFKGSDTIAADRCRVNGSNTPWGRIQRETN